MKIIHKLLLGLLSAMLGTAGLCRAAQLPTPPYPVIFIASSHETYIPWVPEVYFRNIECGNQVKMHWLDFAHIRGRP